MPRTATLNTGTRAQRPPPMAARVEPRPGIAPLRARASALAHAPQRLELTIAMTAARFVRCRGSAWLAQQNDSDYAREHLGLARTTFDTWVRVGTLALQIPEAARGVAGGSLTLSALAELARLHDADAVRSLLPVAAGSTARSVRAMVDDILRPPDPDQPATSGEPTPTDCEHRATQLDPQLEGALVRWAPRLPVPIAAYLHQTLGVAQLVLGHDTPLHECLAAIVAEASTEVELTVTAEEACRRLGIPLPAAGASSHSRGPIRPATPSLTTARLGVWSGRATPPSAKWKLAREHPSRALAHRLDRRLKRQLAQRQMLSTHIEDELLELHELDAPRRLGYRSFEQFVEEALGMPHRTAWDHVARARLRRRGDPLALALGAGHIAPAHAIELERLVRRAYVPRPALGPWLAVAPGITVRRLRRMVDWGIDQLCCDYRAWSLRGFPPPTNDDLRTSEQAVLRHAADPGAPPEHVLLHARTLPHVPVVLLAEADTMVLLAQMIASLQDQAQRQTLRLTGETGPKPPTSWGLSGVLRLARRAWADLALANTHDTHAILERDAYRCAAPGCSRRCNLQAHHIRYRSEQGSDDAANLATLCAFHHQLGEHGGILRVRGTAIPDAGALIWAMGIDEHGHASRLYHGDVLLRAGTIALRESP